MRHIGAYGIWTIFPIYLTQLGANKFWIGIIFSLNPFGQFLFMPYLDRYNSTKLVTAGLFFSTATFTIFGLCVNFWQLIPFQILLALAYSCLYLGSLKHLMQFNQERATAVGIFNSLIGLAGVVGPLIGGFSYRAVMFFAAGLTFLSTFIFKVNNVLI